MSVEITSADLSMSGYKSFEELNKGIFDAAKNIPEAPKVCPCGQAFAA